jgi:hypothetical protein
VDAVADAMKRLVGAALVLVLVWVVVGVVVPR